MNVQNNIVIILTCNKLHEEKLIQSNILKKEEINITQLTSLTNLNLFAGPKYTFGNYECIIEYTDDNTYNSDAYLLFKNKTNKFVHYKFIFIIGDEEYGYQEMIKAMFYLGLGHQVICIIDKIHKPTSFFGYEELNEIRKYPIKYLRNKKNDYYGSIEQFIRQVNKDGLEQLFKLRKNKFDDIEDIFNNPNLYNRYIEQLKYKYLSYPTFTQSRIDFDAPYCTLDELENSFLPVDKICRFTLKPLLKFSFYFGHICRLSNILSNQIRNYKLKMTPMITIDVTNLSLSTNYQVNDNINTSSQKIIRDNSIIYDEKRNELLLYKVLQKLKDYFTYLETIEYVDSYEIIKGEDDAEILYGFNYFMLIRFDIDELEDYDLVKLNFLQYFISRKFNFNFPKDELQKIVTLPNSKEVDYEKDIQRNVSIFIRNIFNKNPLMKNRLLALYQDVDKQKETILYSRYQINTRLHNLYRFILGDDYKEKFTTKIVYKKPDDSSRLSPRQHYPIFYNEKKPTEIKIILDPTRSTLLDKLYLQKRDEYKKLAERLKIDKKFRTEYYGKKRLAELSSYYPQLKKQQIFELYKTEINEAMEANKKKIKIKNKINEVIVDGGIEYVKISKPFKISINNNKYDIYIVNKKDESQFKTFFEKFEQRIAIVTSNGNIPPNEQKLGTTLITTAEQKIYYKNIYFSFSEPSGDNIVEIPIDDLSKFSDEAFLPREYQEQQLRRFKDIFSTTIKSELQLIDGHFIFSSKPNEMYYIVTNIEYITSINSRKILYELNEEDVNEIIRLFDKNYLKLFIPDKVYITNQKPPTSNLYLSIPVTKFDFNTLFDHIIRRYFVSVNVRDDIIYKPGNIVTRGGVKGSERSSNNNLDSEKSSKVKETKEQEIISRLQKISKSYNPDEIVIENIVEVPLTIIQGFYQFISLTYLMDFYNNINNGRRFLKSFKDTLYKEDSWKELYLPEMQNI